MPEPKTPFRRSQFWPKCSIPQKIILDLPNDIKWVPDAEVEVLGQTIIIPLIHRPLLLGILFNNTHRNRQIKHMLEEAGWCIEIVEEHEVVLWESNPKLRHMQFAFSNPTKCYERRAAIDKIDEEA